MKCENSRTSLIYRKLALQLWALVFLLLGFVSYHESSATNLVKELHVTPEERVMMEKLRHRVLPYLKESYMKEDLHIIRWLRATDFDIEKSERLLLQSLDWRRDNKMATILREDFSDMFDEFPYIFVIDKQGQPSFIGFAGEWDIRAAVLTGRGGRLVRYVNQGLEGAARMVRDLQHQGKNVTRTNLIIDLNGFNVPQHACVGCLLRILEFLLIYDNNYPGLADHIIFLNTPPTVNLVVELIRNNANAVTLRSMKIYGTDKNVWRRVLLGFIDKSQLPTELGGNMPRSQGLTIRDLQASYA